MAEITRLAKQVVRGLPYLQKELARRASIQTGRALTTPMTYYVIFSGRCNLACTFCTIYTQKEPTLSGDTMARLVREAKALSKSGFNISLSGGEPTIYKPLPDTLRLAQELGVNFGFTTNGLALTPDNVRRLIQFDPFNINVSLESVEPTVNESLRPIPDGTRRTLRGIENVLTEKARCGSRVSVIVKPTIMDQNYRTLPALVRHFGRDTQVQINLQPFVGPAGDPHWVKDRQALAAVLDELAALQRDGYPVMGGARAIEGFKEYFNNPPQQGFLRHLDLQGQPRNCDIGLRSMFIYPNGDVHFCDFLGKAIGNIHQHSLSEIYFGELANRQRRHMVGCDIDCQQTCKRPVSFLTKAQSFLRMG
jgi:MoaA/NifB/PqqE/SkfB family radical SAM enzyme